MTTQFETVIGFEVHAQLKTQSKTHLVLIKKLNQVMKNPLLL